MDDIQLTHAQIAFLKRRFRESDPEKAIDKCIEFLVRRGENPFELREHIIKMMAVENN